MAIKVNQKILISETTIEEREQIVQESLGIKSGLCDGCAEGIISMYDDYIYGKKELKEINSSFKANYESGDQNRGTSGGSCMA